jgi:hypothetical protein
MQKQIQTPVLPKKEVKAPEKTIRRLGVLSSVQVSFIKSHYYLYYFWNRGLLRSSG